MTALARRVAPLQLAALVQITAPIRTAALVRRTAQIRRAAPVRPGLGKASPTEALRRRTAPLQLAALVQTAAPFRQATPLRWHDAYPQTHAWHRNMTILCPPDPPRPEYISSTRAEARSRRDKYPSPRPERRKNYSPLSPSDVQDPGI